jgi:predicted P-loop ATPase
MSQITAITELVVPIAGTTKQPTADQSGYNDEWKQAFKRSQNGVISPSYLNNVVLILENDIPLKGAFKYNYFTCSLEVTHDLILNGIHVKAGPLKDIYFSAIREYIEKNYDVAFGNKLIIPAIQNVGYKNGYNPLKDYLNDCYAKWDKKIRIDTFLNEYLGADLSEITTLQTKLFFVGAVAKVFSPSIKFDFVLDLVGGQGAGKTTLLQKLGGEWYTDDIFDFTNKDNFLVMVKNWIINDDELAATKKTSHEDIKKFISKRYLEFRKPYGHESEMYEKNFVLARTTNEYDHLTDKTGGRRFLTVFCDKAKQSKHPVPDLTQEIVDQFWGEMVYYWNKGFCFALSEQQEEQLEHARDKFQFTSDTEDQINRYLEIYWPSKEYMKTVSEDERIQYVHEILTYGESNIFNGIPKTKADFTTISTIAWDIFQEKIGRGTNKLGDKIRYIMNHNEAWEHVKRNGDNGYKRLSTD